MQSSDKSMVLAASEVELGLKSVFISWPRKGLDFIKEDWILNAGIDFNPPELTTKLKDDLGLTLKMFTSIDISNNNLESLPLILFQMPSLKTLNLSGNNINCLPIPPVHNPSDADSDNDGFSMFTQNWNCPSLETLELSKNRMTELPKNIFQMPNLNSANFSDNQITSLPFEMWLAPSLKILTLKNNRLKTLPIFAFGANSNQPKKKNKEHPK